jgi:hypothetical protein
MASVVAHANVVRTIYVPVGNPEIRHPVEPMQLNQSTQNFVELIILLRSQIIPIVVVIGLR